MNNTIHYQGIIEWKAKVYSNPCIAYSDKLFPHQNELVLIHTGNNTCVIVPYSNQDRISGVITDVQEARHELIDGWLMK